MSDQMLGTPAADGDLAVHRAVTIEVGTERAFEVFTAGFDSWWPRSHHVGAAEMAEAVLEPRSGGRWYERGVDGTVCDWGHVLAWDPPRRILLAWQLNAEWKYDPDFLCEVEVTFTAEGPARTRVDLVHRNLDRYGAAVDQVRASVGSDGGWVGLLRLFADRAVAEC